MAVYLSGREEIRSCHRSMYQSVFKQLINFWLTPRKANMLDNGRSSGKVEKISLERTCRFFAKYLGCKSVSEPRGSSVCENAIEQLLPCTGQHSKALLYVSKDSIKVVDRKRKALLVDQSIEKVSYCSPDRFHDGGFAYICRDCVSKSWICHGFIMKSSSGSYISHVVGAAFQACLDRKTRRKQIEEEYKKNLQNHGQVTPDSHTYLPEPLADRFSNSEFYKSDFSTLFTDESTSRQSYFCTNTNGSSSSQDANLIALDLDPLTDYQTSKEDSSEKNISAVKFRACSNVYLLSELLLPGEEMEYRKSGNPFVADVLPKQNLSR